MKFQILIRSEDWLDSAGTRIRYMRLKRDFDALGWKLAINAIGSIYEGLALNADVYLFSKCDNASALMLAEMLREAGAIVGFDLFDDYVSGQESLTFEHRNFFQQMIGRVDFLLCSTERIAQVCHAFAPLTPVHVMNDPHGGIDAGSLALSIDAKMKLTQETRVVDVVWFGQGGNPIFPVGLSDAVAFGAELEALEHAGWQVRLKVLANPEALNQAVLGALQSLPVQVSIETWSQAAESEALKRAMVAFLPVNYQNFSIAKSLNRAVSALTMGAQVLAVGFPLYAPLKAFVYRSAEELSQDLQRGKLRLDKSSVGSLSERLVDIADPQQEARALIGFLNGLNVLPAVPVEQRKMRGIIHGSVSTAAIHRLCTSLGWLSLGSPLSRMHQRFHAEIAEFESDRGLEIRVNQEGLARLGDHWRKSAQKLGRGNGTEYTHKVPLPESEAGRHLSTANPVMWCTRASRMLAGPGLMRATVSVYEEIFPETRFLVSEREAAVLFSEQSGMEARA